MTTELPAWALEPATPADRERAEQAYRQGSLRIKWPDRKALRAWAKRQGWPAPWFLFDDGFIKKMLASDHNFSLALTAGGLELRLPKQRHTVSAEELEELDDLYAERDETGRPPSWGLLVGELRAMRRAVEAGVAVEVDGQVLKSFGGFYAWAHGRYHMLEDGYDSWIGDDAS